eukprot:s558_g16.t1
MLKEALPKPPLNGKGSKGAAGTTLISCLKKGTEREILAEADSVYCRKCKEFRRQSKKLDLWSLPPLLIVHLKRFGRERLDGPLVKLRCGVDFEMQLDLKDFMCSSSPTSTRFQLYGVVNHHGNVGGGHYTAHAVVTSPAPDRLDPGEWYNFNDSVVDKANETDLDKEAAYVLFYRRLCILSQFRRCTFLKLNLACQVGVKGMRPTSVSFGALLTAFQKAAFWEQSLLALGALSENSLGLDVQTVGAALAACAVSRRWFEVSDILQKLQTVGIQPDAWMREWALKSQGAGQSASADIRSGGPRSLCQECRSPLHSEQDLLDLRSRYRSLAGSPQPRFPQKPGMSKECVAKVLTSLQEEEQLAESQDTQYVAMREQIDKKAVDKRTQQLHFLDAEKPNKHVVFVDEDDLGEPRSSSSSSSHSVGKRLKDFNLAEYFDTHPMLLQRKANRLRLKQLETKLLTQPEPMAVQAETRIHVNGPQVLTCISFNQDVVIYDRFDRAIPVLQDAYVPDADDFPLRACVKARTYDVENPQSASPNTNALAVMAEPSWRHRLAPSAQEGRRAEKPARIQVPFTWAVTAVISCSVFLSCAAMFLPLEHFTQPEPERSTSWAGWFRAMSRSIRSHAMTSCSSARQIQTHLIDEIVVGNVSEVAQASLLDSISTKLKDALCKLMETASSFLQTEQRGVAPRGLHHSTVNLHVVGIRAWAEISSQCGGGKLCSLSGIYVASDSGAFAGFSVQSPTDPSLPSPTGLLWDAPAGGSPLSSRKTDLTTGRREGTTELQGSVHLEEAFRAQEHSEDTPVARSWSRVSMLEDGGSSMFWTAPVACAQ